MFDEFVKQARQIFSSKKNAGKLVRSVTDRLHYYKQILLAVCIVILLGYSQFRDHFDCQVSDKLDKKRLNNFCWTNGTTTLDLKDAPGRPGQRRSSNLVPHIGMHFQFNDGRYELINHNYMRSLWMLLILMTICSYLAQTMWSSLFNNDTMRALLALPGHTELPLVKKAQEAKAYETLMKIPATTRDGLASKKRRLDSVAYLFEGSELFCSIDMMAGDANDYNHSFDYYPNQLIYLLIAARASAYRLSGLSLKRKIIVHSICSYFLTLMQFILPWLFIGEKYTFYGIYYLRAWFYNAKAQFLTTFTNVRVRQRHPVNSIDYELSARIWPTLTQCEYKKFGYLGMETVTVQCSVSINEICAKLFAVIWWFIAINIVIETLSLMSILICSMSSKTLRRTFARRFWPHSRNDAQTIATFRYEMAKKIENRSCLVQADSPNKSQKAPPVQAANLSEREKKQLEAEQSVNANKTCKRDRLHESNTSLSSKKWYLWCSRDIGLFLSNRFETRQSSEDEEGFRETKEDSNIYYLLYLLYLRFGRSQKKIERVIGMTGGALKRYLDSLSRTDELRVAAALLGNPPQSVSSNSKLDEQSGANSSAILDVMM